MAPGLVRAYATNSWNVVAGTDGWIATTHGKRTSSVIGVNARRPSYDRLLCRIGFMMNVAASDTISVWPSGGDFATYSPPIICVAPGLFSTTTGWPQISESRAPMERERASVAPPGVVGTTIFTGREGKGCASAEIDNISAPTRRKIERITGSRHRCAAIDRVI